MKMHKNKQDVRIVGTVEASLKNGESFITLNKIKYIYIKVPPRYDNDARDESVAAMVASRCTCPAGNIVCVHQIAGMFRFIILSDNLIR